MKKEKHLPIYGVGPIYGISIILATVVFVILSYTDTIPVLKLSVLKLPFIIIGIIVAVIGCLVWFKAAVKIDKYIVSNKLCTEGIYALVRNPCYSGIMFICDGVLFISNNLYLFILPLIYWLAMTLLMKCTEEKWLLKLYGQEYVDYCKSVNRCIPFPRNRR